MSQCGIIYNFNVLLWHKFHNLNVGDINSNIEQQKRKGFYATIKLKLGDYISIPDGPIEYQEKYEDDNKVDYF